MLNIKPKYLAWTVALFDLVVIVLVLLLYWLVRGDFATLANTLAFTLFPIAGAVIITRQPHNRLSWLFILLGWIFVGQDLLYRYGQYALLVRPGTLPFGAIASWIGAWGWSCAHLIMPATILLLPNGQLPSRRWRCVVWAGVLYNLPLVIGMAVVFWPFRGLALLDLNSGPAALGDFGILVQRIVFYWQPFDLVLNALAVGGLFQRFRRSRGIERQQLKWIFLAAVTVPISIIIGSILGGGSQNTPGYYFSQVISVLSVISFPVAFAFAVTRYRLYEIDVIVRRTLVYSVLTATLALFYFGLVLAFQASFAAMSRTSSTLGIVLSTLITAMLFNPLHRGVQAIIDRRFYRQKYTLSR